MDNIHLDISDLEPIHINFNEKSSSNFGSGIELLMNDKVKENTRLSSDIDIEDLNNLENELNDLSIDLSGGSHNEKQSVHFNDSPSIGQSTAETNNANSKTWDGYGKFNNIPLNPDKFCSLS